MTMPEQTETTPEDHAKLVRDNRRKVAAEFYQHTLADMSRAHALFMAKPIPSNEKYLHDKMKDYQEAWICNKCEMEPT
jgi:hypothetical protein